jgi:hypothetical protein
MANIVVHISTLQPPQKAKRRLILVLLDNGAGVTRGDYDSDSESGDGGGGNPESIEKDKDKVRDYVKEKLYERVIFVWKKAPLTRAACSTETT